MRDHADEDRNSDVFEDVSNDDISEEDGLENDLYHSDELESYGKLNLSIGYFYCTGTNCCKSALR